MKNKNCSTKLNYYNEIKTKEIASLILLNQLNFFIVCWNRLNDCCIVGIQVVGINVLIYLAKKSVISEIFLILCLNFEYKQVFSQVFSLNAILND
ncbi:hypothetical protein SDC9_129929 [bioreactor metagenome]|uniref:Uncharacterized protein n=1 Tax=bioreactor metagenome TaxID=1076179 RepID=A0A645D102_9ZZZZ